MVLARINFNEALWEKSGIFSVTNWFKHDCDANAYARWQFTIITAITYYIMDIKRKVHEMPTTRWCALRQFCCWSIRVQCFCSCDIRTINSVYMLAWWCSPLNYRRCVWSLLLSSTDLHIHASRRASFLPFAFRPDRGERIEKVDTRQYCVRLQLTWRYTHAVDAKYNYDRPERWPCNGIKSRTGFYKNQKSKWIFKKSQNGKMNDHLVDDFDEKVRTSKNCGEKRHTITAQ